MKITIFFFTIFCFIASIYCDEESEILQCNKKFTSAIYKEIAKSEYGSFLVSTFSAQTVLTLTQFGSKDETAQEIRDVLHLSNNTQKIEDEMKNLLPSLKGNEDYTFNMCNKMYIKDEFEVTSNFSRIASDVFSANNENVDFLKKDETSKIINSWVEKETFNKISDLINPGILNNRTRIIWINPVYFKANWSYPFYLANTRKMKFYKSESEVVEVDSMHNKHYQFFKFYECHHLNSKFLELDFKGEEASMTFILPNGKEGLAELEKQIDRALLPHNLTGDIITVALPKFKIESRIDFKKILKNLGVVRVFEDFIADLSGISGEKGHLVLSEIVQKSFIDVNEEGVEAAAATFQVFSVPRGGRLHNPKKFIADHPFLFYIKIKGVVVFVGKVTDPSI